MEQQQKEGRARKYHTEEERKAAQKAAAQRWVAKMRETDPERLKQIKSDSSKAAREKYRSMKALVAEAEAVGGARLEEKEVVEARAYVDRERTKRSARFMRRYNNNPAFRARHLAKMADYDRRRTEKRRQQKQSQQ